jgi:dolichol-phosphate mannosyltransferase
MTNLKLSVITPVFNEEKVIERFYFRLKSILLKIPDIEPTILFVVDPSSDRTVDVLRSIILNDSSCSALVMANRFGHQKCLLAGIEDSLSSDAIIMMDCDLQHPPELIPNLLKSFLEGADVVYTVRTDTVRSSIHRKLVGNLFYFLLNSLSQVYINSNSSDFRLISKRVAETLILNFKERDLFLRGVFSWIGYKQVGIEYVADQREAGTSKYSLVRMIGLALSGIMSFSTKPLKLGIFLGLGFAASAFLLVLWAIMAYILENSIPSGWTTIVVVSLLFSGVQLIVLGIMGTYIGGIYEEVKNRPRYIVDERIKSDE